jgi:hypothetical protein
MLHSGSYQYPQTVSYSAPQSLPVLQHVQAPPVYVAPPAPILEVHQQITPPDLNWIGPSTKYKTHYITVPMIKPVKKMVKKVETVMVDEKYWDTKWIAVQVTVIFSPTVKLLQTNLLMNSELQVPRTVMEDQVVLVDEEVGEIDLVSRLMFLDNDFRQIVVEQQVEHQREIKIPQKVLERQTMMVPKQRVVMYEEEVRDHFVQKRLLYFDLISLSFAATHPGANPNIVPNFLSCDDQSPLYRILILSLHHCTKLNGARMCSGVQSRTSFRL